MCLQIHSQWQRGNGLKSVPLFPLQSLLIWFIVSLKRIKSISPRCDVAMGMEVTVSYASGPKYTVIDEFIKQKLPDLLLQGDSLYNGVLDIESNAELFPTVEYKGSNKPKENFSISNFTIRLYRTKDHTVFLEQCRTTNQKELCRLHGLVPSSIAILMDISFNHLNFRKFLSLFVLAIN